MMAGFLLMAFDESGVIGGPLGTFSNPSSGQLLDCSPATPVCVHFKLRTGAE